MSIRLKTILTLLAVAAFAVVLSGQASAAAKKVTVAPGSPAGATPVSGTPGLTQAAVDAGTKATGHKPTMQQALDAYWTPERMSSAVDANNMPAVTDGAAKQKDKNNSDAANARDAAGKGQKPAPDGPAGKGEGKAPQSSSPALTQGQAKTFAYQPGFPYYSFAARTEGKVFFTSNGVNYVCSASIVYSEGRDEVWTAGHCVYDPGTGTWNYNWVFVPAYDHNWRPYGTWYAKQLWSTSGWIGGGDFSNDIGVAIMWQNWNWGTYSYWHIADYLGGQGITWNQSKYQYVTALGYPAAYPFDGESLWACTGGTAPEWTFLWWSANTLKLPCDMTGGSSGGGWITNFSEWSWGYVNGHNDYKYDNDPYTMYSPYYGDNAGNLFNATRYL
jgi:hypothetical protein